MDDNYKLLEEVIFCGIGQDESLLHFGACSSGNTILKILDEFELDIEYTAVDVDSKIKTFFTDFSPDERTHPWISLQETMQNFIDTITEERYNWTLITGIFDKPKYKEKQYQFIDAVLKECLKFSDNVIFTIKVKEFEDFKYNTGFLLLHQFSKFNNVTAKKIKEDTYIFYIKN